METHAVLRFMPVLLVSFFLIDLADDVVQFIEEVNVTTQVREKPDFRHPGNLRVFSLGDFANGWTVRGDWLALVTLKNVRTISSKDRYVNKKIRGVLVAGVRFE